MASLNLAPHKGSIRVPKLVTSLLVTIGIFSNAVASEIETTHLDAIIKRMLLKNAIGFRYGSPAEKQILPINTKEFYYQRRYQPSSGSLLIPAVELSASQLNVGDSKGYVYGLGPAAFIPIGGSAGRLYFTGHGKVHYMTRHEFGRKRYGGRIQWTYGIGLRSKLTYNTFASYMWQHMSNADRYEVNPTLETHTLTLGIHF